MVQNLSSNKCISYVGDIIHKLAPWPLTFLVSHVYPTQYPTWRIIAQKKWDLSGNGEAMSSQEPAGIEMSMCNRSVGGTTGHHWLQEIAQ